jgi:hypothetical protein
MRCRRPAPAPLFGLGKGLGEREGMAASQSFRLLMITQPCWAPQVKHSGVWPRDTGPRLLIAPRHGMPLTEGVYCSCL